MSRLRNAAAWAIRGVVLWLGFRVVLPICLWVDRRAARLLEDGLP